jgi:stearoyl-CoA desaturase (Delta-9 desaturase)
MLAIIATLVMTHITIICVTLYLHRGQAHRALTFNPAVEHAMRFWLWLTTGMVTREWVAVHRKHHQACEKPEDPHSPWVYGIWRVLFGGAWLYVRAKKNTDMVRQYGVGTPDDWIEQNVYSRWPTLGIWIMLVIDVALFGWWGFLVWGVQMIWIPFWAAGVVNGVGHWWGYRNTNTKDRSRNIGPLGIIIGGEELHNNHHHNPASAKLSEKWWEFDIGWMYIRILKSLGLLKLRNNV